MPRENLEAQRERLVFLAGNLWNSLYSGPNKK